MEAGLYIVATPIGNLDDISFRAIDTLKKVEIIICENPKHSQKILSKFGIKKKLYSLHDHNEDKIIKEINKFINEKPVALISDAGSPLISDPGYKLVKELIENNIFVTSIPGPNAIISALQLSSIPTNEFQFIGFSPKTEKKIVDFLEKIKNSNKTTVFFVSNHKLLLCLYKLKKILPDRKISVCKEITKINEKKFIGFPEKIIPYFEKSSKNILGEFVIVVEGDKIIEKNKVLIEPHISKEIKKLLCKFSLTDVVEIVHKLTNISKKKIYSNALKLKK